MIAIQRVNMILNNPAEQRLLRMHRQRIEICNRQLEQMRIARIHAQLSASVSQDLRIALCFECVKLLLD